MRQEKRVLGKGLSALISTASMEETNNLVNDNGVSVLELAVEDVIANPNQPRKNFSHLELQELAESIKTFGVLQPVVVKKHGDKYELVAGERRLKASQLAGLGKIPAIIKKFDQKQSFEMALIENLQREDLNPMEEAMAYDRLMQEYQYTQLELSNRLGKSRSHIANTLRLLNLPDSVRGQVLDGKISAGHARAILKSNNPDELANKIVNDGLSVRNAERLSGMTNARQFYRNEHNPITKNQDLLEIEQMLTAKLGVAVRVRDSIKGGEVIISFNSLEELDGIVQLLAL